MTRISLSLTALALLAAVAGVSGGGEEQTTDKELEWALPRESWKQSFKDEQPIYFVNRNQAPQEWSQLKSFWNEGTEKARDPKTGVEVERRIVKIKVPLGLTQNPPVPAENPLTVAKWALGKRLYFDKVLSSDGTVSCATCHDPQKGYTDAAAVSTGIRGNKGGVSAPTVLNSAYNLLQFWDGRAASLEDQAQGPVQNPLEMFDGEGHAWNRAVLRCRSKGYTAQFRAVFGTDVNRDAVAKAIAAYERTVLSGNSIHDRADLAMQIRVAEEGSPKREITAADYETVLKEAVANKDLPALEALGLNAQTEAARLADVARRLNNGRALFFGKARCNSCHVGDNLTDNTFHNLGVGVKDGLIPPGAEGRFAQLPTGHKNPELFGAFKTPTLRGLVATAPYLHDGSEPTLEAVVDFYDRGGNANEFLDVKMRDLDAEQAYLLAQQQGLPYKGPEPRFFGPDKKPIIPLKLNLSADEKKDLVLFLKALQGDPVDPIVADPEKWPASVK